MIKEFEDNNGNYVFCFVGIELFDYLQSVLNLFESNFHPGSKTFKSGWHSTVVEYRLENITITIGDLYDVLCVTLINPITEHSIDKVKKWVEFIDNELTNENSI
jgi:hypothetical protein